MISGDPGWGAVTLAAWLLTYAFHSTLLLGSVALIGRWRRLPASLEQTLWKTALLGSLITATAAIAGLDGGMLGVRIHLAPASPAPTLLPSEFFGATPAPSDAELPAPRTWMVLFVWALLGGLGLFRLFAAGRRLRTNLGSRRVLTSGPEREMLETLLAGADIDRPVRLTVSDQIGSPIAIGHDEICLPERALVELRTEEVRSALAHELAHLARRDPAWRSFTAGVSAVFFFQPLLRLARRRIDETAEYLADDWAVRHSGSEMSLARCLATVAGWQAPRLAAVGASGMADGTSPLLRRVERLLGARPSEPARALSYAGALLLVIGAWIIAPAATTEPKKMSPGLLSASVAERVLPPLESPSPRIALFTPAPPVREPRPAIRPERLPRPKVATPHPRHRHPAPLLDRETAPMAQVIVIPHEVLKARIEARLDMLRALSEVENLDPEVVRAFLEVQRRLIEIEMAQRGVRVLWMVEPPAPEATPTPAPPPRHELQI